MAQTRRLGKSDISITPILLGTWAIGGEMWGGTNEKESIEAIHTSIDQGVTTIDTAAVYGFGLSELFIGKALKGRRNQVVIATKCGMVWNKDPHPTSNSPHDLEGNPITVTHHLSRQSIMWECEQSLKRLNTDMIDLYQIHWPDPNTPIEESWEAMVQLKQQGKVRAIGVSNYNLEQLQAAHAIHPVDSIQLPYSLIRRDIEHDIVPFCKQHQIAILAYSPLERGLLTGSVGIDRTFPKGDHRQSRKLFSADNRKAILKAFETLQPIMNSHRCTTAQAVISCTMNQPQITGVLIGARNSKQAKENAAALHLNLSAEEHKCIVDTLEAADISIEN